jgi:uncharacterized membrane protein HdeD (DUF308 family)
MKKGLSLPLAVLGLVLFIFGFIAVTSPDMSVQTLMSYLAYMLITVGLISAIVGFVIRKKNKNWLLLLIMGILILALGTMIFSKNSEAAGYYTIFIAAWAALMGLSLIITSLFLDDRLRIVLIVNGLVSLVFGVVIYFNPFTGTGTLNFMVGFYTLLLSVMMLYLSYKIFRMKKAEKPPLPPPTSAS